MSSYSTFSAYIINYNSRTLSLYHLIPFGNGNNFNLVLRPMEN